MEGEGEVEVEGVKWERGEGLGEEGMAERQVKGFVMVVCGYVKGF